jgi:hypothetical protein
MFVLLTFASSKRLELIDIGQRRAGGEYNIRQRWESLNTTIPVIHITFFHGHSTVLAIS